MIPKTEIITDGKQLSRFALGTHKFCKATEKSSFEVLDAYFENGGNIIDTARCYGDEDVTRPNCPESEQCIGEWLKSSGMRSKAVLITKGGNPEYENGKHVRNRITPEDIEADITKSLEALGTDFIDIYFFHKDDPSAEPEKAIELLNKYVKCGVVRHIGASNWSAARIEAANKYAKEHGLAEFEYSELSFSLKDRVTEGWGENERALEMSSDDYNFYRTSKIPVLGYGAQAYGFFYGESVPENASDKNREIFMRLKSICDKRHIDAHNALFGFYFGCDINCIPLVSAKNVSRLKEAAESCNTVLTPEDVKYLFEARF